MEKTNLKQAKARLTVEGKLSEKKLKEVQEDGQNIIKGSLTIQTDSMNFVEMSVYVSELKKDKEPNPAYKGIKTVMEEFKSIPEVGSEDATLVQVRNGQIRPNTYYDQRGTKHEIVRYSASYFGRVNDPDAFEPKAQFEIEVYISAIKEEFFKTGENQGEPTGRKIVEGWVPMYNETIEPIVLIAEEDVADGIEEYEVGQTVKFIGDARNSRVEKTREIPVKIGKPRIEKVTEYVNELIITGASEPYDEAAEFSKGAIDKALVEREAILANLKEKATKPKSKASEMPTQKATANPNRPMPKGW